MLWIHDLHATCFLNVRKHTLNHYLVIMKGHLGPGGHDLHAHFLLFFLFVVLSQIESVPAGSINRHQLELKSSQQIKPLTHFTSFLIYVDQYFISFRLF